ncbi:MAG: BamA/TamA family outer membrane protein [Cyclonatronaceae bacterium]
MRIACLPLPAFISATILISSATVAAQPPVQQPDVDWVIDGNSVQPPAEYHELQGVNHEQALLMYLGDRGYFQAAIDSVIRADDTERSVLYASAGCRFSIGNIRQSVAGVGEQRTVANGINGDTVDMPPGLVRSGEPFSAALVNLERQNLSEYYIDRGYILVSVQLGEPDFSRDCEVDLHFIIDTGRQVVISGQLFPTVERNSPEYLGRITALPDSAVADRRTLRQVRRNLQQSGLFERVDEPGLMLRDGRYYLVHDLRERRTNVLDLLLGYVPDPGGGGGDIAGTGMLRIRNAAWNGSMIFLRYERMSPQATRFQGEFQQRWMFGIPVSAGGSFRFIQQDSTYQLRNIRFETGYAIGGGLEVFGSVRREASSSNKSQLVPVRVLDGTAIFGGVGMRADTRNDILVPTSGFEFHIELETGNKRIDDERASDYTNRLNYRQQELYGFIRPYYMPFRRQVIAPSLDGFIKASPEFTESDLFRTGGANSVRGYREDQFLVSRILWGNLEYRYLLDRTSYAFVFTTTGWYHRPRLIVDADEGNGVTGRVQSGGFGFSYRTPVGQLRFSYAISAEDSFTNGKVHFGLVADL